MHNKQLLLFSLLISSAGLSSCGGGGGSNGSVPEANNANKSNDLTIAERIYKNKRIPAGFFTIEEPLAEDVFYSVSHVKNIEILAPAEKVGLPHYELSTNDFAQALIWSEQAASNKPVYKQLVDNTDTELYFQFERVDLNNTNFIHLSRVFKSDVIDRSGVDLTKANNYQGKISSASLDSILVKQIIEYLWTFSFSNNYGNTVIESNSSETGVAFNHILLEAKMTSGGNDACDTIEIFESQYSVDKTTGEMSKTIQTIRTYLASFNGSTSSLCP